MTVRACFPVLCAAMLALPGIAASQSPPTFQVKSTEGWQPTTLKLTEGQKVSLSATGSWTVDQRRFSFVGPDGYSSDEDRLIFQGCKLDSSLPYGVLLARVGDAPAFSVGNGDEFKADREGFLEFRIHDDDRCLVDNSGSVTVAVRGPALASVAPVPLFYCINSNPGPARPDELNVCESVYSPPEPSGSLPIIPAVLTSPHALDCLSFIDDAANAWVKRVPALRALASRSPGLLGKLGAEFDGSNQLYRYYQV